MENRLPLRLFLFFLFLYGIGEVAAQQSAFTINYTGPDTLFVDNACEVGLDWGHPASVNISSVNGDAIDTVSVNSISGGFAIGDIVMANQEILITYFVQDVNGVNAILTNTPIKLFIADTIAPFLNNIPSDTTVACDAIPTAPVILATDNCDNSLNVALTESFDTTGTSISVIRLWTATDIAGNITIDSQIINLLDTLPPSLMGVPSDTLVACDAIPVAPTIGSGGILATDNCGLSTNISFSENSTQQTSTDSCGFYNYTLTRTWVAVDNAGNSDSSSQIIQVTDTLAPTFTMPADTVLLCELRDSIGLAGMPTDILDNCDANPMTTFADAIVVGNCQGGVVDTLLRTWTVSDVCGNQQSGIQRILLIDTIAPSFTVFPTDTIIGCAANLPTLPTIGLDLVAIDNCLDSVNIIYLGDSITQAVNLDTCTHFNYEVIRSWEASDACNNRVIFSQTIQVVDTIAPTFTVPPNITVACELKDRIALVGEPTSILDNCATNPITTFTDALLNGNCQVSGITDTLLRTWVVSDACGNSATAIQQILLIDTLSPVFVQLPMDTIVPCDDSIATPNVNAIMVMDNCDSNPAVQWLGDSTTQSSILDDCAHFNFTIFRTWETIDKCQNRNTRTQTIQVIDTEAPTFVVPPDTIISCEYRDSLSITGQPSLVQDNCDATPTASFTDLVIGGNCVTGEAIDTIMRTWQVVDACGNISEAVQRVILIDTIPPIITGQPATLRVQCTDDPILQPVIGTDIMAIDNCGATPLLQLMSETNDRVNAVDSCGFYNYSITRTWRATDACNNQTEFIQIVEVVDTIAPIIFCPEDISLMGDTLTCSAQVSLPQPYYFDDCNGVKGRDSITITQAYTHDTNGDVNTTPVDTLTFSFGMGNAAPFKTITGSISLTIELLDSDIEGVEEFFFVVGEDGTIIGETENAANQCGASLTSLVILDIGLFNEYASDGVVTFQLVPNSTGAAAINNVCDNGRVSVTLEYDFSNPTNTLALSYRVDGGAETPFQAGTNLTLGGGNHTITYIAEDCSGNRSSCSIEAVVNNVGVPDFQCPAPITHFLDTVSCNATLDLPFPSNFEADCGFVNNIKTTAASFLTFTTNANAGVIPIDIFDTLNVGTVNPIGDAVLTITLQGDVSDPGEFFNIIGENGMALGSTSTQSDSLGACVGNVQTQFTISMDTLLAWSADGIIEVMARPNQDVINFSDFIGPCGLLDSVNVDQNSQISWEIAYPSVIVNYEVIGVDSTIIATGFLTSFEEVATEIFPVGINTVTYLVEDEVSTTQCSFMVEVRDTLAPIIACNPTFSVTTNPSGLTFSETNTTTDSIFTLLSDNCGIATIDIDPERISCDSVGLVAATVTVTDASGNQATCNTSIQVVTELLEPTFSLGACDNDTLYLFADTTFLTPLNPNTVFSYQWSGPANFNSNDPNPIVPGVGGSNSGSYSLTITGLSGCTASGSVFVDINNFDIPALQSEQTELCINEEIILTTNTISCDNIEYRWHEIISRPNQSDSIAVIAVTTAPRLVITEPQIGPHSYFLLVACDECVSSPSPTINITAFEIPVAETIAPIREVCEGAEIILGVNNIDPTATYSWVGPGFTSSFPNPQPIPNATQANQGVYSLIVSKNGCTSESDFTVVNVKERAEQPTIVSPTGVLVCEGQEFILLADVISGSAYNWTNLDNLASFTTSSPSLQIDSISATLEGDWVLSITSFGCESEQSNPINVAVEKRPSGTPFFNGIACEGGMIPLDVNPALAGGTYEWTSSSGTNYFGRNPEALVEEQFDVQITSINGCQSTNRLTVSIEDPPVITTIFDSGDADPCIIPNETEVILAADVFPPNNGSYTYTWSLPNGTTLAPTIDSILIIPNTSANEVNGTYSLTVQTNNSCVSDPATEVVAVTNIPTPSPSLTANATTLCEGEDLTLTATAYEGFVAQYHWRLPTIDTITQSPILIVNSVTTALSGLARVEVSNASCTSIATATLDLQIDNGLRTPSIIGQNNSCAGSVIELQTEEVSDAIYFWEGPDYSATSATPTIIVTGEAGVEQSGGYTVQIKANGCESSRSIPFTIDVTDFPMTPVVNNSGDVCLVTTDEVTLFVTPSTVEPNSIIKWFDAATNQQIASSFSNTQVIDVSSFLEGTYGFYATQEINGCVSQVSNITELVLAKVPTNQAVVCEANVVICHPNDAVLCAEFPSMGTGTWTVDSPQIQILEANSPETKVQGVRPGETYLFTWTLSDPNCGNYSFSNLLMRVSSTGALEQACSAVLEACDVNSIELCANTVPNQLMGKWSQPSVQENLGVSIADLTNPNTTITGIEAGRPLNAYTFYWTISDDEGTCPVQDTVKVNVYDIPTVEAMVIDTELTACDNEIVVNAIAPPTGTLGRWTSENKDLNFGSEDNISTLVSDLKPGTNTVFWNISAGPCGDFSSQPITIFYEQTPIAIDDNYSVEFSRSSVLTITENDDLVTDEYDLMITNANLGEVIINEDLTISYKAPANFIGEDQFTYELCSSDCPEECSQATVTLNIGEDAGCIVPTIITPNGDGVNDAFVIPCLETDNFPQNEVSIFNQWGDELFRASPYQNNWRGTYDGNEVPVGTYYYIVSFGRNEEPVSGFLVLER